MRLELLNVTVETNNEVQIAKYKALGYREVGKGKAIEDLTKEELIELAKKKNLKLEDVPDDKEDNTDDGKEIDYNKWNKDDIVAELKKQEIEHDPKANKSDLIALLQGDE